MSNLGTIYELDLNTHAKNKYPVVYENEKYYYYKVYGNDCLSYCRKTDTLPYSSFKEKYPLGKYSGYRVVKIFVGKGIEPDFSFVESFSHEELAKSEEIRKEKQLINAIDRCKGEIVRMTSCNETYKKMIEENESDIEKLQVELVDKQDKLIKFREANRNKEESK